MQSAVKTKQRARSDIKLAQEQATLQVISVIQTTIQCGIAQVCFSRNLFPSSFFRHVDIGIGANGSQNGDSIVVFDLDDPDSHSHSHSHSQAHSQAHSGGDNLFHRQSQGNSSSSGSGSQDSQESNLPLLSPLTSDFNYTANSQSQFGSGACSGTDVCSSDAIMKAEVRLLLHWVRGLWDILSDDDRRSSLMRVVFGICKPGGEEKEGTVGDRVLESFAFDMSSMMRQAGGAFEHQSIQNQYQTLFRNLQSFTSMSLGDCQLPIPDSLGIDTSDRYFTLRVEFHKECRVPQALDPFNIINRDSSSFASAGVDNKNSNSTDNNVKSILAESMQSMVKTPLGKIVEKHCTGLGIKITAYNNPGEMDIDQIEDSQSTRTRPRTGDQPSSESSHTYQKRLKREKSEDGSLAIPNSQCRDQTQGTCASSQSISVETVFDNGARAYAIPLPPPFTSNYAEYKKTSHYLSSCTILDSRLKDQKLLQYKVSFDSKDIEKPKQWIASRKVISEDTLISRIEAEFEFVLSQYRDKGEVPGYGEVVACISKVLNVTKDLVEKFINFTDFQRICHDDSYDRTSNSDNIGEERSVQKGQLSEEFGPKSPLRYHYCFAMHPFTVVL